MNDLIDSYYTKNYPYLTATDAKAAYLAGRWSGLRYYYYWYVDDPYFCCRTALHSGCTEDYLERIQKQLLFDVETELKKRFFKSATTIEILKFYYSLTVNKDALVTQYSNLDEIILLEMHKPSYGLSSSAKESIAASSDFILTQIKHLHADLQANGSRAGSINDHATLLLPASSSENVRTSTARNAHFKIHNADSTLQEQTGQQALKHAWDSLKDKKSDQPRSVLKR